MMSLYNCNQEIRIASEEIVRPGQTSKRIGFFVVLLSIILMASQKTVENPSKPLSKSAGRVVKAEEVLRIKEIGQEFFFRFPHNIKISPKGTIFVMDQEALYQFDANGKFIRNFFKKGQGPGEMGYIGNFLLHEDKIIVYSKNPNKILWHNDRGTLEREISVPPELTLSTLQFYSNGKYYFEKKSWPNISRNEEIIEVPEDLIAFDENTGQVRKIVSFPTKYFIVQGGGGQGMIAVDKFLITPWQESLVVSHTSEYLIKVVDLKVDRLAGSFRRKYKKVRALEKTDTKNQPRIIINDKTYTAPHQKFEADVIKLFAHGDQLWVMTSTVDKHKGILFDVFDREGRYIDNFYLRLPHQLPDPSLGSLQMEIAGDYLYLVEKNENEIFELVKYRLHW